MKHALIRIGLLVPLFLGCAKRDIGIGDFKTFTSTAGRFTADCPGVPTASEQERDSPLGKVTTRLFILPIGTESEYSANYTDPPANVTKEQTKAFNVDMALIGARNGIAGATKSVVINERKITLDKWPGREWELAATGDAKEDFRWRLLLRENAAVPDLRRLAEGPRTAEGNRRQVSGFAKNLARITPTSTSIVGTPLFETVPSINGDLPFGSRSQIPRARRTRERRCRRRLVDRPRLGSSRQARCSRSRDQFQQFALLLPINQCAAGTLTKSPGPGLNRLRSNWKRSY